MHIPKKGLRALGIAESYAGRTYSTLVGVVMRKDLRIDGFVFSTVTVGGMDATDAVIGMVEELNRKDINLILLSGLEPEKDIKIVFTGLRPGEKMFEELFRDGDVRMDTGHPDIFAAKSEEADLAVMRDQLARLRELCALADAAPLIAMLMVIVSCLD